MGKQRVTVSERENNRLARLVGDDTDTNAQDSDTHGQEQSPATANAGHQPEETVVPVANETAPSQEEQSTATPPEADQVTEVVVTASSPIPVPDEVMLAVQNSTNLTPSQVADESEVEPTLKSSYYLRIRDIKAINDLLNHRLVKFSKRSKDSFVVRDAIQLAFIYETELEPLLREILVTRGNWTGNSSDLLMLLSEAVRQLHVQEKSRLEQAPQR